MSEISLPLIAHQRIDDDIWAGWCGVQPPKGLVRPAAGDYYVTLAAALRGAPQRVRHAVRHASTTLCNSKLVIDGIQTVPF
jgi:hypothetical protein